LNYESVVARSQSVFVRIELDLLLFNCDDLNDSNAPFDTQMFAPSKAMPFEPNANGKVPGFVPPLALSLSRSREQSLTHATK
jgi:hypothetical protein